MFPGECFHKKPNEALKQERIHTSKLGYIKLVLAQEGDKLSNNLIYYTHSPLLVRNERIIKLDCPFKTLFGVCDGAEKTKFIVLAGESREILECFLTEHSNKGIII